MSVLKCKMCGADLNITDDQTVCECEYCGSKQTIPKVDDEKKVKLFERANRLRRNCEFDKAASVYESIVADFEEEAEAYWGLVLCKFGIEYVDDPATGDKMPTCHRSSFDSVMDDPDFELVMEYADPIAKRVYRDQAKQIEEIRKGIVEVSGKEAPYDIFICYKETDENGDRTLDSVLAQDVYDALTDKGYRVFFSRISLEDKLGTEYEPYIFAALNSAKVMLAFGTDYEYYDSVWVKNEWSRFLKLMAKDKDKHLIPCYKGIDAYDIPKEFAKLQAQDMGKVGAVQDLIRGIDKIMHKSENKIENRDDNNGNLNATNALTRRGWISLEDGQFEEAKACFNKALDLCPESADAYWGMFAVDIKAKNKTDLKRIFVKMQIVDNNRFYKRAKQYASGDLLETIKELENERNSNIEKEMAEFNQHKNEYEDSLERYVDAKVKYNEALSEHIEKINGIMLESKNIQSNIRMRYEEKKREIESEKKLSEDKANQLIQLKKSKIETAENTLLGLGLFKMSEKKEQQDIIDKSKSEIIEIGKKLTIDYLKYKQMYEDIDKELEREIEQDQKNASDEISKLKEPTLPVKPRKSFKLLCEEEEWEARSKGITGYTQTQLSNGAYRLAILDYMEEGQFYSKDKILKELNASEDIEISDMKLSALLRALEKEGKVEKSGGNLYKKIAWA